jgi:hypothetical protein
VVDASRRKTLVGDTVPSPREFAPGSARETSRTWLDRVLAHTLNRCRACGSSDVRRSRIRPEERGAHGFRSPYRCEACHARYWVISRKAYASFVSGGLSVLIGVLLAVALSSSSPRPSVVAGGAPLGVDEVIVPISRLPDQFDNETHRLESLTAPLTHTTIR